MSDKHEMQRGESCSLFNSGYAYSEGFNFYHCRCGDWTTKARPSEAPTLFLAHVTQTVGEESECRITPGGGSR